MTDLTPIRNQYDIYFFMDVTNGNPNGDPEADGAPRYDNDTGHALVSPFRIKRDIRDTVYIMHHEMADPEELQNGSGCDLYIKSRGKTLLGDVDLKLLQEAAPDEAAKLRKKSKKNSDDSDSGDSKMTDDAKKRAVALAAEHYFDVRTFGAVMTTFGAAGGVRGPVQTSYTPSVDPVEVVYDSLTQCISRKENQERTMGSIKYIRYGLFRIGLHISTYDAALTGFSERDLSYLIEAVKMFPMLRRSVMCPQRTVREVLVFKHAGKFGAAHDWQLEALIHTDRLSENPRSFEDYNIWVEDRIPNGVTLLTEHMYDPSRLRLSAA